jgi:hypothetical protein
MTCVLLEYLPTIQAQKKRISPNNAENSAADRAAARRREETSSNDDVGEPPKYSPIDQLLDTRPFRSIRVQSPLR